MSLYQAIRFRGTVKREHREKFEGIALHGEWRESEDPVLREFGEENRSQSAIPLGASYMISRWQIEPWRTSWNTETGEWIFQCDVNMYSFDIIDFNEEIVPYLMESVEHYETACEAEEASTEENTVLFQLKNGKLEVVGSYDTNGNFRTIDEIRKDKGVL